MDSDVDPHLLRLVTAHAPLFRGAFPDIASYLSPGWYQLVDRLCTDIEAALGDACAMFEVLQVKEKFGGLRFYYRLQGASDLHIDLQSPIGVDTVKSHTPSDETADRVRCLVQKAEADSKLLCEKCGASSKVHNLKGWLVTLCEQHLAERVAAGWDPGPV
jgi:hypothetical protein